jgi:hypothetical protein
MERVGTSICERRRKRREQDDVKRRLRIVVVPRLLKIMNKSWPVFDSEKDRWHEWKVKTV